MKKTVISIFLLISINQLNANAPVDDATLEAFFVKKLYGTKFTKKAFPYAQEATKRFLLLATSDCFDEAYEHDPITNTYTIYPSKMPDNLKRMEWRGSNVAITRNALGQWTAKPDKSTQGQSENQIERKFNTLAANWLNEYLISYKYEFKANSQKEYDFSEGVTYSISSLSDYINKEYFGGKDDFQTVWANHKRRLGSYEAIKNDIMKKALAHLVAYKKNSENRTDFKPVKNMNALIKALLDKDWDTFVTESYKLGWRPEKLLY